jgi:hypothetical protein
MKTLKRLKNILSGEKEDKTETPEGESVQDTSTEAKKAEVEKNSKKH